MRKKHTKDGDDKCRKCGKKYPQGGDGYDGMCPDCADKTFRKTEEVLIPVDLDRCQSEKPSGNTFMTFGGVVGRMVRCTNKPTHIAIEPPREDGRKRGSMSLCGSCIAVCSKGVPGVTFEEIKR